MALPRIGASPKARTLQRRRYRGPEQSACWGACLVANRGFSDRRHAHAAASVWINRPFRREGEHPKDAVV
jgi:hypothetical protein